MEYEAMLNPLNWFKSKPKEEKYWRVEFFPKLFSPVSKVKKEFNYIFGKDAKGIIHKGCGLEWEVGRNYLSNTSRDTVESINDFESYIEAVYDPVSGINFCGFVVTGEAFDKLEKAKHFYLFETPQDISVSFMVRLNILKYKDGLNERFKEVRNEFNLPVFCPNEYCEEPVESTLAIDGECIECGTELCDGEKLKAFLDKLSKE